MKSSCARQNDVNVRAWQEIDSVSARACSQQKVVNDNTPMI